MPEQDYLVMPKLGLTMTEGMVSQWPFSEGQSFKAGDIVVVVESEKTAFDVEAPAAGSLLRILVAESETVPVGTPLAEWQLEGEANTPSHDVAELSATRSEGVAPPASDDRSASTVTDPTVRVPEGRILASPRARRRANEAGLDLKTIRGTGPTGEVTDSDVAAALAATETSHGSGSPSGTHDDAAVVSAKSTSGMLSAPTLLQKTMADRVARAKREIPHFYLATDIDIGPAVAALRQFNNSHPVKATVTHLLIAAIVRALRDVPSMNAIWTDAGICSFGDINIGLAVNTDRGLMNPIIRDLVDGRFTEIIQRASDAITKAKRGSLRARDQADAAITLSNAGSRHVRYMTSIIVPNQSSIMGVGAVQRVYRPDDAGQPELREELGVALSADHRLHTGVGALQFLEAFERALAAPIELMRE